VSATIQVEEEKSRYVVEQVGFVSNPYDLSRILTICLESLLFGSLLLDFESCVELSCVEWETTLNSHFWRL